jgi:hypothetical protein
VSRSILGVHHPSTGVIALGELSQCVGGGEGERHAGRRAAELAEGLAGRLAEQSAQQLAAELFKILRGEPTPAAAMNSLMCPWSSSTPCALPMPYTILICKRNDGHGRPGLGQQFQRAVDQLRN